MRDASSTSMMKAEAMIRTSVSDLTFVAQMEDQLPIAAAPGWEVKMNIFLNACAATVALGRVDVGSRTVR